MYKLLLCWRYLRTRYIALAPIISVMLGVATLIVTNAVMQGFQHDYRDRIHGFLSDLIFSGNSLDGFPDADARMAEINRVAGEYIAAMSPTVAVPAMLGYESEGGYTTRQITVVGIDERSFASVSDFGQFLQHRENRAHLDFKLKNGGYDVIDHQATDVNKVRPRNGMQYAGWPYRRVRAAKARQQIIVPKGSLEGDPFRKASSSPNDSLPTDAASTATDGSGEDTTFDPMIDQHDGCVLGIGICSFRNLDGSDSFRALPGHDVEISYPTTAKPPKVLSNKFTIVDFYECKMSQFDSDYVFVPIRKLQEMRGMVDPSTGTSRCNSIQIRLKKGVEKERVRDLLRENFSPAEYSILTWQDKEGALIAAVQLEIRLLNILLFMIIAVAGFGILAIFFMIVVEKTRDIGILKSLGASSRGIMGIFLAYGLSLGIVGTGVGLVIGLLFVHYINPIADFVGWVLGQPVFDPSVYYFDTIPTIVDWFTVTWIVVGAIFVAILASILPARRAARLHPVEALRYE